LRFKEFEGEWERKRLGEVTIKVNSGKTPLGGESIYTDEGVIFIRSQNVNNERLELGNSVFISAEINQTMQNSVVLANDILLNITGASLGRSCVVPDVFTIGNVNQHVCIIRVRKEYNPRFIQPFLSSDRGQNNLQILQTGSGREGLNFDSIKRVELYFPSPEEQNKIASFLTLLDERISTQSKIISESETLMKGLGDKLFNQQLRFKDERGNGFPNWIEKFGNEVFENISEKNPNSDLPILAITQEYGAIPRDMIDFNIAVTEKSVESYKVVQIGDFIISLRSFQGGIEYSKYKGICSPAYIVLRAAIPINQLFFKHYFKTRKYITELNKKLEGIRDGKMISYSYFSDIKLPLPSTEEQTCIANLLSSIDEKIETEKKILQQYENQKKHLLHNMFI
jgi:type I restriction enzyme S subunit